MLDVFSFDLHDISVMASELKEALDYQLDLSGQHLTVRPSGRWLCSTIAGLDARICKELASIDYDNVTFDLSGVGEMDTSGAYLLARSIRNEINKDGERVGIPWDCMGTSASQRTLIKVAAESVLGRPPPERRPWYEALERLGFATVNGLTELYDTLAFFGRVLTSLIRVVLVPQRVRWKSVTVLIEEVGLDALPIVMMLSFFIGCVIAFMGAQLLAAFGVQIFMVDLVGLAVLREFAVLIMAIMMAARSNSAFTASIGSMKMRQEIDAMTVIGLNTDETLVAPRALACLVSAPILTFAGMVSGLIGGACVARFVEDISFNAFFIRISNEIPIDHFWVGMIKAPVFALVIAMIGCRHGLAVEGSVESLGKRTTASVVQAIFSVIVLDAIFAMVFLEIGY